MLFSEYLTNNNNIIEIIYNDYGYSFLEEYEYINTMLKLNKGSLTMVSGFELITTEELAPLLDLKFGEKWKAISSMDLGSLLEGEKTINNNGENVTNTDTIDETELNKTTEYESDNLLTTGGTEKAGNNSKDIVKTGNSSTVKSNLDTVNKNLQLSNNLTKITTVINDIASYNTISIY